MVDLAIWMAGHVSVPVYPTLTAERVRGILEHSEARLGFLGKLDHFDEMQAGIPSSIDRIAFPLSPANAGDAWNEIVGRSAPLQGRVDRDPDEVITIMYTSGSTGTPKGVMHSFRTMNLSQTFCEVAGITAS